MLPDPGKPGPKAVEPGASLERLVDPFALQALHALSPERDAAQIARELLVALGGLLSLECASLRSGDGGAEGALEETWPPSSGHAGDDARALDAGVRLARIERRFPGGDCAVVVGARRPSFPTAAESLLLRVAVDQAAIALRAARLLAQERSARADAERRAAQSALAAEVGAALALAAEPGAMLQRCAEVVARRLGAACAAIWTPAEDGDVLALRARAGDCELTGEHGRVAVGEGAVGSIARDGRPRLTNEETSGW